MLWLDRATFFFLCVFAVVIPFTVAGVEICAATVSFLFIIRKTVEAVRTGRIQAPVPGEILVPVLLFLAVCAVSIFWSVAPLLSARAFVGKTLLAVVTLLCVAATVTTPGRLAWLTGSFLAGAAVLACDGLWQAWSGADIFLGRLLVDGRVCSIMKHPNSLGAYLIFAVMAVLALAIWSWTKAPGQGRVQPWPTRGGLLLLGIVLCTVLGLTYSRGAWLGFFVALVVFISIRRQYALACMAVMLLFAVIFSPLMTAARNVSFVSDDVVAASPSGFTGSDRLNMWKDAFKIIRDYPVLGTGLNTYTTVIYKYSENRKLYPHNSYLQMAAELGLVGLGVFLWLLWGVGRFVAARIAVHQQGVAPIFLAALLAGWSGFLVQSGVDTTLYSVALSKLFWLMTGALVAGAVLLEKKASVRDI